jgi:hypothetical protein
MMLIVSLCRSRFSYFYPAFKKWCRGDRSHASLVSVARLRPLVASVTKIPGVGGTLQGATSTEVAETDPQLGDSVRNWL